MARLHGIVALVTGASRGAGRGIALELGTAGATVYVTGRSVAGAPTTDDVAGTIDESAQEITTRGGRGIAVRTVLAGEPDPSNPASIPEQVLAAWRGIPGLELLGQVDDIREVWARAHVAVLPSRREGLPKSLLEAAACGRALIATDVPGCREVARAGLNALLVPVDQPEALAEAIAMLSRDAGLRSRFAAASRQIAVTEYSNARIQSEITALYRDLLRGNYGRSLSSRHDDKSTAHLRQKAK